VVVEQGNTAATRGVDPLLAAIEADTEAILSRVAERLDRVQAGNGRRLHLRSLAEVLTDPDALKPPEAVVPRVAYRAHVALVAGREKLGGKSTLLTAGAAAVTRGAEFLGERCVAGSTLWISADQEHTSEIAQRAVRFGADPERFHVLWPREPLADLNAAVERVEPILLVIDTLANFVRVADPHSAAEWPAVLLPLIRLARDRDMAVAIAHHAKKNDGGGYRDSSAIGALVDLLLELQPDAGNPGRRNVTVLGRWPAVNFAVELTGDWYHLVAAGELSLDARVLAFVQQHPECSQAAVRGHVGGRAQDADAALGRLLASGAVSDAGTERRHAYCTTTEPGAGPRDDADAPPF
jgi:hypothetical protein